VAATLRSAADLVVEYGPGLSGLDQLSSSDASTIARGQLMARAADKEAEAQRLKRRHANTVVRWLRDQVEQELAPDSGSSGGGDRMEDDASEGEGEGEDEGKGEGEGGEEEEDVWICGVCGEEEPPEEALRCHGSSRDCRRRPRSTSSEEVEWVGCDGKCAQWFHVACLGIRPTAGQDWFCEACRHAESDDDEDVLGDGDNGAAAATMS